MKWYQMRKPRVISESNILMIWYKKGWLVSSGLEQRCVSLNFILLTSLPTEKYCWLCHPHMLVSWLKQFYNLLYGSTVLSYLEKSSLDQSTNVFWFTLINHHHLINPIFTSWFSLPTDLVPFVHVMYQLTQSTLSYWCLLAFLHHLIFKTRL